jgi:hypothetical protein
VSTEEDGVDEAGPTTQPPLIMAPPSLKADPDGEATDTIVDNGIMSSSRARTGSSRSGASKRVGGTNGESSSSGDAATATPAATADEDTAEAGPSTTVPLPADTIGKGNKGKGQSNGSSGSPEDNGRSSERQGSREAMTSGDSTWVADRKTETAESTDSAAAPATSAVNGTSAAKTDYKPSFTPSAPTPSAPTAPASPTETGTGSSYSGTAFTSPSSSSSYSRSGWSTPATPASAPPASAPPASAPAGNGFSSGAASAVTGAAAGLASSVTSAFQKRGSAQKSGPVRGIQTRKSTKRQAMLTLARVEPWSVMKFSFVASVVAFIILFVAVAVLYMVLSALGVFDSLQNTVSSVTSSQSDAGTNISHWFSASLILGYTAMLGALNIVLITAMSTVGSVIYNLIAKTIGGIEVTLRETD